MIGLSDKNAPKMNSLKKTYEISGEKITFETWKLGLLINGAVTISDENDNILFVSTWFKTEGLNMEADFFPLVVDYQEKFYATGKIGWNRFQKREGRPSDDATLTARLIDRPIRPMFPKWIINDTQIIATVLSASWEKELWFWWIVWASLGLMMAWTPFEWLVSASKIALTQDWKYIFNPTTKEEEDAKLSLLVAWTLDAITMVEAWAKEVSDQEMLDALKYSHKIIKDICEAQKDFIKLYEKEFGIEEVKATLNTPDDSLYSEVRDFLTAEKMDSIYNKGKKEFQKELNNLDILTREYLSEKWYIVWEASWIWQTCSIDDNKKIDEKSVGSFVYKRVKEVIRKNILENEKRLDGRKLDEVREVVWEVGLLPRTHGSALFQRGMTQALSIVTLAWPDDRITVDWMMPEREKRYFHHYNFPPYSVWEVRMMRWVWRREIWHGALWERALLPVLPSEEEFPYTMRVVSEITTCNGSSSMASVCGSTMSLMNAWVPIKTPVAWVAMGMVYDEDTWNYKILSDIQAQEDFLWDMDFKVARTKNWITAMQLDVKIKWLKMEVFKNAFKQWEEATNYILERMLKVQAEVSPELSKYAPLIMNMKIEEDQIKIVIGKGWENVQRMEKEYWVKISIAEDWMTTITAQNQEWGKKAIDDIERMLWEPKVWYIGKWVVGKIIDWVWAIIDFKGKNWMIHISKLAKERVTKVQDIVEIWDDVEFEVIQIDKIRGKIGLKRKYEEKKVEVKKKEEK